MAWHILKRKFVLHYLIIELLDFVALHAGVNGSVASIYALFIGFGILHIFLPD